jgi:hypothetical protein
MELARHTTSAGARDGGLSCHRGRSRIRQSNPRYDFLREEAGVTTNILPEGQPDSSAQWASAFGALLGIAVRSVFSKGNLEPTNEVNYEQVVVEVRLHRDLQLRSRMFVQSDNDSHGWNLPGCRCLENSGRCVR